MRRLITVFERKTYAYSELGIEPDSDLLAGIDKLNLQNKVEYVTLGRTTLQTNQYVGVLKVNETTLQILPKIDCDPLGQADGCIGSEENDRAANSAGKNFIYLLALVDDLKLHPTTFASLETTNGQWLELLTTLFCMELTTALQGGFHQDYIQRDEQMPYVRGRWNVGRQYSRQPNLASGLDVTFDDFIPDTQLNRTFRFAIQQLRQISREPHNLSSLARLDNWYEDAGVLIPGTVTNLDGINFTRLTERFEPAFRLARLLIENQTTNMLSGQQQGHAIFFDMDRLFEEFVAKLLIKYRSVIFSPESDQILVDVQKSGKTSSLLTVGGINFEKLVSLRPDIQIRRKGVLDLIIDTKNKNLPKFSAHKGLAESDAYQMLAYATHFKCQNVLLLYPRTNEGDSRGVSRLTYNNTEISLYIGTLNMHRSLRDLGQLVRELRDVIIFIWEYSRQYTEETWV